MRRPVLLKIIPRAEWQAEPPLGEDPPLPHPVTNVVLGSTETSSCRQEEECHDQLRHLLTEAHVEDLNDIKYNFIVSEDGWLFEGRGWHTVPVLPTRLQHIQHDCIYISYFGFRDKYIPTGNMVAAVVELIKLGIKHGFIKSMKRLELVVRTREQWKAVEPKGVMKQPGSVSFVICAMRTNTKVCETNSLCETHCRDIQSRDMADGLDDIRYNFLIGADNRVYEGRGWGVRPKLPKRFSPELEAKAIYLAFMGPLTPGGHKPTQNMNFARNMLIEQGVNNELITNKFLLYLIYKV